MRYKLSTHAQKEIERRGIPLAVVEAILEKPDQIVPERGILKACQSKREIGGKMSGHRGRFCKANGSRYSVPDGQDREIQGEAVKVTSDPAVDVLRILLSDTPVEESDKDKPGVILDYDKDGNVVGLEILEASKRIANPRSVEYAVTD